MSQSDEVRAEFACGCFGTPCTEAEISRAEEALGELFPAALRELYLAFDGFRGPTNARFFWPLFGPEGLVYMNQFYRCDDLFPHELVAQCLFFGDEGTGPQWGFKRDLPGKIVRWDAEWGDDFEVVGENVLEVWLAKKAEYNALSQQAESR